MFSLVSAPPHFFLWHAKYLSFRLLDTYLIFRSGYCEMGSTFSSEEDQKILEAVKSSCENKKLVLSSMNLTALPVQVLSCPPNYLSSIRTIDLKLNPISTMNGITLQHFPSLTSLNLSQTKIGVFPPQLTALHSLQVLKFGQNHLKSLRIDDLKRYTALRELNISGKHTFSTSFSFFFFKWFLCRFEILRIEFRVMLRFCSCNFFHCYLLC